jgi:hypothetical protein
MGDLGSATLGGYCRVCGSYELAVLPGAPEIDGRAVIPAAVGIDGGAAVSGPATIDGRAAVSGGAMWGRVPCPS